MVWLRLGLTVFIGEVIVQPACLNGFQGLVFKCHVMESKIRGRCEGNLFVFEEGRVGNNVLAILD
jgi:hypothetical protein